LIGHISFTDHFWLLLAGTMPTPAQRRILDATLVAIAEHGLVPSVQASRMTLAAAPEALQGAVAAGILGRGSVVLGSSEAAGQFFAAIAAQIAAGAAPKQAAMSVILEYRAARRPIPGYGHPLHKGSDPRANRLLAVAAEAGSAGVHIDIALEVERLLPELIGKPLALTESAANSDRPMSKPRDLLQMDGGTRTFAGDHPPVRCREPIPGFRCRVRDERVAGGPLRPAPSGERAPTASEWIPRFTQ
jgi:citrate synthase